MDIKDILVRYGAAHLLRASRVTVGKNFDIDALQNLIDPAEEEFLRNRLHPEEFIEIMEQRVRAVIEYLREEENCTDVSGQSDTDRLQK
jgi:hypothetical protein